MQRLSHRKLKRIQSILKEDFDWITDIPSFIEITSPVTQDNPKDVFRLYWTNEHYTGDYGVWAEDWVHFKNDSGGIKRLTRYIKILKNGMSRRGNSIDFELLVDLYFNKGQDYIATDWMKGELPNDEPEDALLNMLVDDLSDLGIYNSDSTIERWRITYFDENGVEFNTKINQI